MMETTHYELPAEGISLLGYVVRRMHKTRWLTPVRNMAASGQSPEALAHVAVYAMLSSTSYGRAGYQPSFNRAGDVESEADPVTGASVTARIVALRPRIAIDYDAVLSSARFQLQDSTGAAVLTLTSAVGSEITLNVTSARLWSVTVEKRLLTLDAGIYSWALETTDAESTIKVHLIGTLAVKPDLIL
jgi:hypothetical protein